MNRIGSGVTLKNFKVQRFGGGFLFLCNPRMKEIILCRISKLLHPSLEKSMLYLFFENCYHRAVLIWQGLTTLGAIITF